MELNPEVDLEIDITDLTSEFKRLSLLLFRYYTKKAIVEREYDAAKASYDEIRAYIYRDLRSDSEKKYTEKALEAEIDCNETVVQVKNIMLDAKRDLVTWTGAVESLKAKKDMLIQLGADARKDL